MPHSNPCPPLPPQKKTWISLFSLSKGKLHLSDLFMSLWGGGGGERVEEFDKSICHWDGKFYTIKKEWKI